MVNKIIESLEKAVASDIRVYDMKEKSRCPLENSDFIKYIPHPMKERNDNLNFEYMKTRFIA